MNLNDLKLFVHVVDYRGFSAAARNLGIPKSTVSHRIYKLEQTLGARLLQRTSRRFTVTDLGGEFYRHASAMVIEAEAAREVVQRQLAEPAGTVRIATSSGTSEAGLGTVLMRFAADYPRVHVHLDTSSRVIDLVEDGFDMAVRAHHGQLPDSSLIQRRLGFSARWLIASPTYIEQHGIPATPHDLAMHRGISMTAASETKAWHLRDTGGSFVKVGVSSCLSANDPQTLRLAALSGLGIAAIPAGMCRTPIAEGAAIRILPDWHAEGAEITMLMPSRRGQLPAVRALADFIAAELPREMELTERTS